MKKLIGAVAGLAVFAPAAQAASHFLKVSPSPVHPGKVLTVSGSVGNGCQTGHKGDVATIYSRAFKGATKQNFAGVPSISASLSKSHNGAFSVKITLSKTLAAGTYTAGGRCGGGNFGSAKVRVTKASSAGSPGFY